MSADLRFHTELRTRLVEDRARRAGDLAAGSAKTIDDYREQVGYIRAVDAVLEACKEIQAKVTGEG